MAFNRADRIANRSDAKAWPRADGDVMVEKCTGDTWYGGRSSWERGKMGTFGRRQWQKLILCALAESPADIDDLDDADMAAWAARTKVTRKQRYGFDPITWILISIVVRIAVELILKWLENRNTADPAEELAKIKAAAIETLPLA